MQGQGFLWHYYEPGFSKTQIGNTSKRIFLQDQRRQEDWQPSVQGSYVRQLLALWHYAGAGLGGGMSGAGLLQGTCLLTLFFVNTLHLVELQEVCLHFAATCSIAHLHVSLIFILTTPDLWCCTDHIKSHLFNSARLKALIFKAVAHEIYDMLYQMTQRTLISQSPCLLVVHALSPVMMKV